MTLLSILSALLLFISPLSEKLVKKADLTPKKGSASFYSNNLNGKKTAFGERFNNKDLTAAHPHLPYNTLLEVTNLKNNKKVVVRVNDRGPHGKTRRALDMSKAAASTLDMIRLGVAMVEYKVVGIEGRLFSEMGLVTTTDILNALNNK